MEPMVSPLPPGGQPRAERVWAIGLDGATFRVLDPLVEHGWMPNLARLMRTGATGSLLSTLPPITAPAWTSFLTGCNPGRHGVYAFRGPMRGSWERPISNATAIRAPCLWQFLDLFGYSSGLINVPMTYPVKPLRGYIVAGMLTPDGSLAVAYPESVQRMLRAQQYVVDLHVGRRERQLRTEEQIIGLADDLIVAVRRRVRAALELLDQQPTTFFAIVFTAPDRIQHCAWRYIERLIRQPEVAREDRVCKSVLAVYQEVDRALGALLARLDGSTAVTILSDHGFCGLHTRVHLSEWLARNGWLRFRQGAKIARHHARQRRGWLKRLLPRRLLLWGRRALAVSRTLEWERTLAYVGDASEGAIHVNVKGREPEGTVAAGKPYRQVRSEIVTALAGLCDPRDGSPVMEHVHGREEVYCGPFLNLAPDIVFEPAAGYETTPEVARGDMVVDVHDEGRGMHARDGVLIVAGAGVRQARDRGRAEIVDVAPTIMYLLGLPVPSEMDGRVLEQVLAQEWLAARPPQYEPMANRVLPQGVVGEEAYTSEERRLLEGRLGDLGYIE